MTKSHNRPERERLPRFKAGISVVKKVKLTVVTGAGERFSFRTLRCGMNPDIFRVRSERVLGIGYSA